VEAREAAEKQAQRQVADQAKAQEEAEEQARRRAADILQQQIHEISLKMEAEERERVQRAEREEQERVQRAEREEQERVQRAEREEQERVQRAEREEQERVQHEKRAAVAEMLQSEISKSVMSPSNAEESNTHSSFISGSTPYSEAATPMDSESRPMSGVAFSNANPDSPVSTVSYHSTAELNLTLYLL
jgi:hypothetical protein